MQGVQLDDASPFVSYEGFAPLASSPSTAQGVIIDPADYQGTLSSTSTDGASASVAFNGEFGLLSACVLLTPPRRIDYCHWLDGSVPGVIHRHARRCTRCDLVRAQRRGDARDSPVLHLEPRPQPEPHARTDRDGRFSGAARSTSFGQRVQPTRSACNRASGLYRARARQLDGLRPTRSRWVHVRLPYQT